MSLPVHADRASLWVCTAVSCVTQVSGFLGKEAQMQVTDTGVASPGLDEPTPQTPRVLMQEPAVQFLNSLPTWEMVCITGQLKMHRRVKWWALLLVWILLQASFSSKSLFKAIWTIEDSWVTEPSSLETVSFCEVFFLCLIKKGQKLLDI